MWLYQRRAWLNLAGGGPERPALTALCNYIIIIIDLDYNDPKINKGELTQT